MPGKKQDKNFTAMLTSSERFELLKDGWIRDAFLNLEWGPTADKEMNFKTAEKYCAKLGGRLPEIHELHSIVNFAKSDPATFELFKDTKPRWYWSATKTAWSTSAAWCVGFSYGYVDYVFVYGGYHVRPVRSSQC